MSLRIGIFGGSFNPPHNGHVEICKNLLFKGDVDKIWIIPCFNHPFGKELASFKDRLIMCKFAFGTFLDKIKVLDVEQRLSSISHTVRTVEYLQSEYPEYAFSLVIGGDTMEEIKVWKDFERIRSLVPFVVVPRGATSYISNISSTNVRANIKSGKKFADMVPREVAVYIITHGLYS